MTLESNMAFNMKPPYRHAQRLKANHPKTKIKNLYFTKMLLEKLNRSLA